ncbi:MAG: hypothetical protein COA69_11355 [Robiginitomaculum sp.]|nr:MAG: hypothetical protein COA69_11355 [Robiginitomaculum sp.]
MKSPEFDNSYARLPERFFKRVTPEAAPDPHLLKLNHGLAKQLGLSGEWLGSEAGIAMLSGQSMPDGADPIAMVYAGHQFGGWSPQLGDGRAALVGEVLGPDGVRWDIQLKGSGRTPFSRSGDGESALGPVLREYIVSEAMAAYGVPTTRALAACTTGRDVVRETRLPGAVLTRVAQSHVRIGTFQYFYARSDAEALRALSDYVIARHFPQAASATVPYAVLLESVVRAQAQLVAKWLGLGFIHGVMNTDNMQIVGETIDYGPCAFMDVFDANRVFSSIDRSGRYAWAQQPEMAFWNLKQLAQSLSLIIDADEIRSADLAQQALACFSPAFQTEMDAVFGAKFGFELEETAEGDDINSFLQTTFSMMALQHIDFTLFFRRLTQLAGGEDEDMFLNLFDDLYVAQDWLKLWRENTAQISGQISKQALAGMQKTNPIYIPRNHRVAQVIEAALQDDFAPFHRLVDVLNTPYTHQPEHADLELPPSEDEIVSQTFCGT